MTRDRDVLIFTRFSVVTSSGYKNLTPVDNFISRNKKLIAPWMRRIIRWATKSKDERKEYLFSPGRMEKRFALFETVCLPSLANQTEQRFDHIVLISTEAPTWVIERLEALSKTYRFRTVEVPPDRSIATICRAVASGQTGVSPIISMRLDDDDAIAKDVVEKVTAFADEGDLGTVISFGAGYTLDFTSTKMKVEESIEPLIAIGIAYIEPSSGSPRTIHGCGNHVKVWQQHSVRSILNSRHYLMSNHSDNDSRRQLLSPLLKNQYSEELKASIKERFAVDLDVAHQRWRDALAHEK